MNDKYDVVVVGGSAAGIPAAITARRYYQDKSILVIRNGEKIPIPCGIPYIFGTLHDVNKNLIPDDVLKNNRIDLLIGTVEEIDKQTKSILANGTKISYERLILATGSNPLIPPLPGIDLKNIFPIYKDTVYLGQMLDQIKKSHDIVIIGGGFIGVEFAEECKKNGNTNVTLVEVMPKCLMSAFDDEFCDQAEKLLTEQGIALKLGQKVKSCVGSNSVEAVELENGEKIKADLVILGIGAAPNVELAKTMNLELGKFGGILVDPNMRTNQSDIFACGDCVDTNSFFTSLPSKVKLASTATMQARIAGANLFNIKRSAPGIIGVFSTALSGQAFACAGLTERQARENGYDIVIGQAQGPNRHPGGMPGMQNMQVKLIFNRYDKTIIGGQLSGANSAGELINAISAFISSRLTADDIAMFQLGTHPALTASPIAYQLINAAEMANMKM